MSPESRGQRAIVETLVDHGVEFILIGGHAVGAHGFERATKDVDIVPGPAPENLGRLVDALTAIGAEMEPVDIPEHGQALDAEWLAEGGNFIFRTSLGRLDVLQSVAELTYEDLAADAVEADLGDITLRVCSYDRLLEMKRAAGRDQDLLDLERLREARSGE